MVTLRRPNVATPQCALQAMMATQPARFQARPRKDSRVLVNRIPGCCKGLKMCNFWGVVYYITGWNILDGWISIQTYASFFTLEFKRPIYSIVSLISSDHHFTTVRKQEFLLWILKNITLLWEERHQKKSTESAGAMNRNGVQWIVNLHLIIPNWK